MKLTMDDGTVYLLKPLPPGNDKFMLCHPGEPYQLTQFEAVPFAWAFRETTSYRAYTYNAIKIGTKWYGFIREDHSIPEQTGGQ